MPEVNLSALNGRELRQLLDASRRRGDAALSYSILQEMAARRDEPVARKASKTRRRAKPRVVAIDLADPMEKDADLLSPEPENRAAAPAEPEVSPARPRARRMAQAPTVGVPIEDGVEAAIVSTPPLRREASRPLTLRIDDSGAPQSEEDDSEDSDLRLRPVSRDKRRTRRGVSFPVFAGFTLGVALGTAFGWLAAEAAREALPEPARAVAPMQAAALTPTPSPVTPPSEPNGAAPPLEIAAADAAQPAPVSVLPADIQEPEDDAEKPTSGSSLPAAETVKAAGPDEAPQPTQDRSSVAKGCAAEPTAADRTICGDPQLQRLQRELRQAYAEALDAHEDRDLLRQRQLAWRDERNAISDPDRLTALYEQRIRKLNAAAAAARRQRQAALVPAGPLRP